MLQTTWATFVIKIVAKNFKKLPNLVALLTMMMGGTGRGGQSDCHNLNRTTP